MLTFECPSYIKFKSELPGESSSERFIHNLISKSKQELNSRYVKIMRATNGKPIGIEFRHRKFQQWAFIVEEMSDIDIGAFRVQMFDEKGFYNHSTFSALDDAIEKLAEDNFTEIDSGILDKISETYTWKSGAVSFEILTKVNCGRMSYEEGCSEFEAWKLANPAPTQSPTKKMRY